VALARWRILHSHPGASCFCVFFRVFFRGMVDRTIGAIDKAKRFFSASSSFLCNFYRIMTVTVNLCETVVCSSHKVY
jgi:hypothetical protein